MKNKKLLLRMLIISMGLGAISDNIAVAAPLPSSVNGQQRLPSLAPMLERVLPAVVIINIKGPQMQPFIGMGSGVIFDAKKRYVFTNHHVIKDADEITVGLLDGSEYKAKLIGGDAKHDIAVLQIEDASDLHEIKIADSDTLRVGDSVVAIGNPFGIGRTATLGIVSSLNNNTKHLGLGDAIQTDAAINRGNSGGPLVNLRGELVGMNSSIISPNGVNSGVGFAIKSNTVKGLGQDLIQYGKIRPGKLGIAGHAVDADIAKSFLYKHHRGVLITEVIPDSAAAAAGIKVGDVLISFNNQPINNFDQLLAKLALAGPGGQVKLGLLRQLKEANQHDNMDDTTLAKKTAQKHSVIYLDAKLDEPDTSIDGSTLTQFLSGAFLRDTKSDAKSDTQSDAKHKEKISGVKVDSIINGSMAFKLHLQKDDVIVAINGQEIKNIAEMRKFFEVEKETGLKGVFFTIERKNTLMMVGLNISN